MTVLRSFTLFVVAALFEIGGAWLVWQGLREHKGWIWIGGRRHLPRPLRSGGHLPVRRQLRPHPLRLRRNVSSPGRSPGAWSPTATAPTATTVSAPWAAPPAWPSSCTPRAATAPLLSRRPARDFAARYVARAPAGWARIS